jgi:hypothetical protein
MLKFYEISAEEKNVPFIKEDGSQSSLDLSYLNQSHPNFCLISEFEMQRGMVKVWFCSKFTAGTLKDPKRRDNYVAWIAPKYLMELFEL